MRCWKRWNYSGETFCSCRHSQYNWCQLSKQEQDVISHIFKKNELDNGVTCQQYDFARSMIQLLSAEVFRNCGSDCAVYSLSRWSQTQQLCSPYLLHQQYYSCCFLHAGRILCVFAETTKLNKPLVEKFK